ncbi:hypothetical protein WR25_13019 [Diploscapter pachys]|uniref:Uncharacterized protein n=1 Tax=Diploscapter pachys TaxID=2018661 RepID=A0A2A2M3B9_9BILA|nr:hypothetical protein WR25_13019 [Diploscapter pachys]
MIIFSQSPVKVNPDTPRSRSLISSARPAGGADRCGQSVDAPRHRQRPAQLRRHTDADRELGQHAAIAPPLRRHRPRNRQPPRPVLELHQLHRKAARPVERLVQPPQRAAPLRLGERRSARPGKALRTLPGAIDANEEERQSPRPDAMQRRQPVRHLLEPRPESPLQQLQVVPRALASPQEPGIGHHHRRREIAGEVPPEQPLRRAVGKARPLGERIDLGPRLDLRQLIGGGKGPAGAAGRASHRRAECGSSAGA